MNNKPSIYWFTSHRTRGELLNEVKKRITVHDHEQLKRVRYSKFSILKLFQVFKYIKNNQITHLVIDSFANVYFSVVIIAKINNVKVIIRIRGGMWNEYMDFIYKELFIKRWIKNVIRTAQRNAILAIADTILTVSIFGKTQILYECPYINPKKINILIKHVSQVRLPIGHGRDKWKIKHETSNGIITTVSGFNYKRKCEAITYYSSSVIKCLKQHPKWKWIIIGDGKFIDDIISHVFEKARKAELPRNQIQFLGFKNNIEDILFSSDIFFYPSFRDAASQALKEAQAYGLPTIVNRSSGGPVEFIPSSTLGQKQLFEEHEELEDLLISLITDENLRHEIGWINKQHAAQKYTLKSYTDQFLDMLLTDTKRLPTLSGQ